MSTLLNRGLRVCCSDEQLADIVRIAIKKNLRPNDLLPVTDAPATDDFSEFARFVAGNLSGIAPVIDDTLTSEIRKYGANK